MSRAVFLHATCHRPTAEEVKNEHLGGVQPVPANPQLAADFARTIGKMIAAELLEAMGKHEAARRLRR